MHIDADNTAADDDPPVRKSVFDVFMLPVRRYDIGDPYPHGNQVERHENADRCRKDRGHFRKNAEPDHDPDKGAVEQQPNDGKGHHLQDTGNHESLFFRLSAPKNAFPLGEHFLYGVALRGSAAFKIIFVECRHFYTSFSIITVPAENINIFLEKYFDNY